MDFSAVSHPGIKTYMQYVEHTESPRLFHIWCFLSGIAACLGRRCWYEDGIGRTWPNMYVILSGPPAVRKGAAINFMRKLLVDSTHVRFAPDDTGGARQGLIVAMADIGDDKDEKLENALAEIVNEATTNIADLAAERIVGQLSEMVIDTRDPYSMYVTADELNSILGENQTQLLTFLQVMYDSTKPYDYYLKSKRVILKDAVLNILAGTTPTQMAIALPQQAVGQGFTSRCLFVHQEYKHARLPEPSVDLDAAKRISDLFSHVFHDLQGIFRATEQARAAYNEIYMRGVRMDDPRFLHYCERRHVHLRKVSMALAASRGSMEITEKDLKVGDELLMLTETTMKDALGEYGMTKISAARQRLLEVIRSCPEPLPLHALFAMVDKDMSKPEFQSSIAEFHNAKKITKLVIPQLGPCVVAVDDTKARKRKKELSAIEQLLEL